MVIFQRAICNRRNGVINKFTFQYGYISTGATAFSGTSSYTFTFQYGYISTIRLYGVLHREYHIYIPIWLYFNNNMDLSRKVQSTNSKYFKLSSYNIC